MVTARRTRLLAGIAATLAAVLGVFGLATWWLNEWRIASFGPDLVPMAPLTGALFMALGLALASRIFWPDSSVARGLGLLNSWIVLVIAGLVIAQAWLPFPLPWDDWLVGPEARDGGIPLGRMSPLTALTFILSAAALLVRSSRLERNALLRWSTTVGAAIGLLTAAVVLLSYAAGTPLLYGGATVPMALTTAIGFFAFDSALLLFLTVNELARDRRDQAAAPDPDAQGRTMTLGLIGVALGVATFIALAGFFYLRRTRTTAREAALAQLAAVADLKAAQIADWRRERLSEGRLFLRAPAVVEDLAALVERPDDPTARRRVYGWLETLRGGARYESALVFSASGALLLGSPESSSPGRGDPLNEFAASLHARDVVFGDLRRDPGGPAHLELLVPLRLTPDTAAPMAVVALRIDPEQTLFPLLRTWPASSSSGELLLLRREGGEVVYLSELRHQPAPALTIRRPVTERGLAAAIVLGGDGRTGESLDYRAVPVLYASRRIPGSSWVLVAKLDQAEAFASARREAWLAGTLVALLLLTLGQAGLFVWRQRHAVFLRRALLAEQEHRAVSERLALITRHANDVVLLFDENKRIIEANDKVIEVYGRTPEEMRRMSARDLRPGGADAAIEADFEAALKPGGSMIEAKHQRRDGRVFPVEVSARPIMIQGRLHVLSIIRDITERRAHEIEIERLNRLYSALSRVNQSIVHARDRQPFLEEVCRGLVESGGFPLAWIGWADRATHSVVPVAQSGAASAYLAEMRIQADQSPHGQGPAGVAIRENRTVVCNDFLNDPLTAPWHEAAAHAGLRAAIALPICPAIGERGVFAVYAKEPGFFGTAEISLLEEASADIVFGLENLEREARRQEGDRALHASLRETEALLKEVHHRVKNNLQVITSLLRLEAGRSHEPATRLVLKEMQGRIRSMALLHETLYRSGNFARVDMADYLRQLVTQLVRAQGGGETGSVKLILDLSPTRFEIDQAIPCGLIVNELVANSLKHGFPAGSSGEIHVFLGPDGGGRIRLRVRDTGAGLPADFQARRERSLGLQLVTDLVRQIGGQLEIAPDSPGASFTVDLPAPRLETMPIVFPPGRATA